jgi:transposase
LAQKTAQLKSLVKLARHQFIDLFFADESGFSLTPYVPYGWQPIGEQRGIPTKKEHIANVLGFLNPLNNQLITYTAKKKERIDSAFMVSRLNDLAKGLKKETVVVLDNAPWHRSKEFLENISRWQEQGLFVFHLPVYSPHLNLIETLWRKIKYEWLRPKDYNSKTAIKRRLKEIFTTYGEPFLINFSMNIYT